MSIFYDPEFGERLVALMAAMVLVLQIVMAAQRWLVTNIRIFGLQSFLLAVIAGMIAVFNGAPHLFFAAVLTLMVKAILVPVLLERLVERIEIHQEIEPFLNVPLTVLICGGLTLLGYSVAESFHVPESAAGRASLGHNTLAVAVSLFLIGFFVMINRRKALTQVLALLSLENGLFLAAVLVLGILVYRIRETFDSMDVSKMRRLRG